MWARKQCSPQSFCASGKFMHLEGFWCQQPHICIMLGGLSRLSRTFPVDLETIHMFHIVFFTWWNTFFLLVLLTKMSYTALPQNFPDGFESFRKILMKMWIVSRLIGYDLDLIFLDCRETFQNFWKFSELSGNVHVCLGLGLLVFLNSLELFQTSNYLGLLKFSRLSWKFRIFWILFHSAEIFQACLETCQIF